MTNVFDLANSDTRLKKVSSSGGGEYAGPCPFCGGTDRFRVQPVNKEGGRWYCRHCGGGKWNDSADYVMRRNNVSFPEARRLLDGDSPFHPIAHRPAPTQAPQHETEYDIDVWQARAMEFTAYCEGHLIERAGDDTAKWLSSRGITGRISVMAHLGYNPKDINDAPEKWGYPKSHEKVYLSHGLTIPNIDTAGIHAIKIRRPDCDKKYIVVKGSGIWMYGAWTCNDFQVAFLFESELDALVGLSSGYGCGYLALPAGQKIKPVYQYILGDTQEIVIMPDNDDPGLAHAEELSKIKHFYIGLTTSAGKDISEYHQSTGLDAGKLLDYLYDCAGQAVAT